MAANTAKVKAPRGPIKDRVLYMAYKGSLTADPIFKFNKDELIDELLNDKELQVKKITIPRGTRKKAAPTLVTS